MGLQVLAYGIWLMREKRQCAMIAKVCSTDRHDGKAYQQYAIGCTPQTIKIKTSASDRTTWYNCSPPYRLRTLTVCYLKLSNVVG